MRGCPRWLAVAAVLMEEEELGPGGPRVQQQLHSTQHLVGVVLRLGGTAASPYLQDLVMAILEVQIMVTVRLQGLLVRRRRTGGLVRARVITPRAPGWPRTESRSLSCVRCRWGHGLGWMQCWVMVTLRRVQWRREYSYMGTKGLGLLKGGRRRWTRLPFDLAMLPLAPGRSRVECRPPLARRLTRCCAGWVLTVMSRSEVLAADAQLVENSCLRGA